jgi:hypothetical protein
MVQPREAGLYPWVKQLEAVQRNRLDVLGSRLLELGLL